MFTNLLQSLEAAKKHLGSCHLEPALAMSLPSTRGRPVLNGYEGLCSRLESKNKQLNKEKPDT